MVFIAFEGGGGLTVRGIEKLPGLVFDHIEVALVAGRYELVGVRVRTEDPSRPLTDDQLRRIPRGQLARIASGAEEVRVIDDRTWERHPWFVGLSDLGKVPQAVHEMPERPRGGSREYDDAVALVVRDARRRGVNVARELAEVAGVGPDRANQYIAQAVKSGALPKNWKEEPVQKVRLPRRPPASTRASSIKKGNTDA